VLAGVT